MAGGDLEFLKWKEMKPWIKVVAKRDGKSQNIEENLSRKNLKDFLNELNEEDEGEGRV